MQEEVAHPSHGRIRVIDEDNHDVAHYCSRCSSSMYVVLINTLLINAAHFSGNFSGNCHVDIELKIAISEMNANPPIIYPEFTVASCPSKY